MEPEMNPTTEQENRPNQDDTWTAQTAALVFAEFDASGLSLCEFAKRKGYSVPRLYYWKKRIAHLEQNQATPAFAKVRLRQAPSARIEQSQDDQIEIVSPSGWSVRCRGAINSVSIKAILAAIGDAR